MASLRRTKLKAKRAGCNVKAVDGCNSVGEVIKLMEKLNKKVKSDEPGK